MLGRQRRRCASSRQFEIAIGLTSRQRHGRLRPPATALPLSVGRPFAFAWNESSDTAVLPFASQINCIPPAKANNCSFKMEVIFCVQGAAGPPGVVIVLPGFAAGFAGSRDHEILP